MSSCTPVCLPAHPADRATAARNLQGSVGLCVLACSISDARRPSDVEFFQQGAAAGQWGLLTVRIEAPQAARVRRGWVYTVGIDDADSECSLDGREWDVVFRNDEALPVEVWHAELLDLERKILATTC